MTIAREDMAPDTLVMAPGADAAAHAVSGSLRFVIIGLSITSSWGNGHATTYRGLVKELVRRGHQVLFLEHDKPWYAANRDMPCPTFGQTALYESVDDLRRRFEAAVRDADVVIVGSYVVQGVDVGRWVLEAAGGVTAFYDIDTPVTLAKLSRGDEEYVSKKLIARYNLYLSFTGGPTLRRLERDFGSPQAVPLYCSADLDAYSPCNVAPRWDLGYLGTYSDDRQPTVQRLLIEPARRLPGARMVVAGPQYPADIAWPANVHRREHVAPADHRAFYCAQRFTLNVTRADMIRAGFSPSVRLFEAAACGVPIISDAWEGLDTLFEEGSEVLIAGDADDVLRHLSDIDESRRREIGRRARERVLCSHSAAHRAAELEAYARIAISRKGMQSA